MLEKVKEKISMIEVLKDVADNIERIKQSYVSSLDYSVEQLNDENVEQEWLKDSYRRDIEEAQRKISCIEKISDILLKLI